MIGRRDRYREGGPMDDVAANIRADQQEGPDPNPYIPCAKCETRYAYKDYWKPRYVDPDDVDPHEAEWLCDECAEYERRTGNNREIWEWAHD